MWRKRTRSFWIFFAAFALLGGFVIGSVGWGFGYYRWPRTPIEWLTFAVQYWLPFVAVAALPAVAFASAAETLTRAIAERRTSGRGRTLALAAGFTVAGGVILACWFYRSSYMRWPRNGREWMGFATGDLILGLGLAVLPAIGLAEMATRLLGAAARRRSQTDDAPPTP